MHIDRFFGSTTGLTSVGGLTGIIHHVGITPSELACLQLKVDVNIIGSVLLFTLQACLTFAPVCHTHTPSTHPIPTLPPHIPHPQLTSPHPTLYHQTIALWLLTMRCRRGWLCCNHRDMVTIAHPPSR